MPKLVSSYRLLVISFFFTFYLSFITPINALYKPSIAENAKKEAYQKKIKTYAMQNQQKLESLGKKIAEINKKQTEELNKIMDRQAQILDEYDRRNITTRKQGANDLSNPRESANYWLTYAHEAVAYQAAKNYIFSLSSEANIKKDAANLVSELKNDINILQGKVRKSQKVIESLVTN